MFRELYFIVILFQSIIITSIHGETIISSPVHCDLNITNLESSRLFSSRQSLQTDSSKLDSLNGIFTNDLSVKEMWSVFQNMLIPMHNQGLSGYLFKAFSSSLAEHELHNDTTLMKWYSREWVRAAKLTNDEYLKMCYSAFYLLRKGLPLKISNYKNAGDTLSISLADQGQLEKFTGVLEISRLECKNDLNDIRFRRVHRKKIVSDSLLLAKIKMDQAGIYRTVLHNDEHYMLAYCQIGYLYAEARTDGKKVLVRGYSAKNSVPPPYEVTLVSGDEVFACKTDKLGYASIAINPVKDSSRSVDVIINKGSLFTYVNVKIPSVVDQFNWTGYAYSNLSEYRPGDTVHIGGMVRRFKNEDLDTPDTDSIFLELTSNCRSISHTVPLNSYSHFHHSFKVPFEADTGLYDLRIIHPHTNDTIYHSENILAVRLPVDPEFTINVDSEKEKYYGEDTVHLEISARYLGGGKAKFRKINCNVFLVELTERVQGEDWLSLDYPKLLEGKRPVLLYSSQDKLNETGKAFVSFKTVKVEKDMLMIVCAKVESHNHGYESKEKRMILLSRNPFVRKEDEIVNQGDTSLYKISLSIADTVGTPMEAIALCSLSFYPDGDFYQVEKRKSGNGLVEFSFRRPVGHIYKGGIRIISASDSQVPFYSNKFYLSTLGKKLRYDDVYMWTDKELYQPGDTALISVQAPSGTFLTINNPFFKSHVKDVSDRKTTSFRVPVSLKRTTILDFGKHMAHHLPVSSDSNHLINVELSGADSAEPGSIYEANVTLRDKNGNLIEADFSLSVTTCLGEKTMKENRRSDVLESMYSFTLPNQTRYFNEEFLIFREVLCRLELISKKVQKSLGKTEYRLNFGAYQTWSDIPISSMYGRRLGTCMCGGLCQFPSGLTLEDSPPKPICDMTSPKFLIRSCYYVPSIATNEGNARLSFPVGKEPGIRNIRLRGSDGQGKWIDFSTCIRVEK